jgi:hypothetical protein
MKNKWLEWTPEVGFEGSPSTGLSITPGSEGEKMPTPSEPCDKIIGKVPEGEPTKPTKAISAEPQEYDEEALSRLCCGYGDQYGWRLNRAFEIICGLEYPAGTILWLETAAPHLYDRLTRYLPDRISHAWDAKVPFNEFDRLCHELEEAHRQAVLLRRQSIE